MLNLSSFFFRFTPEQLGITASSALVWLFVEIMAILFSMYLCNVQAEIKWLDLLAFCGYKYFGYVCQLSSWTSFGQYTCNMLNGSSLVSMAYSQFLSAYCKCIDSFFEQIGILNKLMIMMIIMIAITLLIHSTRVFAQLNTAITVNSHLADTSL